MRSPFPIARLGKEGEHRLLLLIIFVFHSIFSLMQRSPFFRDVTEEDFLLHSSSMDRGTASVKSFHRFLLIDHQKMPTPINFVTWSFLHFEEPGLNPQNSMYFGIIIRIF